MIDAVASYVINGICLPTILMYQAGWFYSSIGMNHYAGMFVEALSYKIIKD